MIQRNIGRQGRRSGGRADADFFPFEIFRAFDRRLSKEQIIEAILQSENHGKIPASRIGIDDVGPAHQTDRNLTRQHRLHRSSGDNENQLRFDAVLPKNALLLGDPQRLDVVADRSMSDQDLVRVRRI